MMDCERNDRTSARFANDERARGHAQDQAPGRWPTTHHGRLQRARLPGRHPLGGCDGNVLPPCQHLVTAAPCAACGADDFYAIYEEELFRDLETMVDWSNRFNMLRSRDCNVLRRSCSTAASSVPSATRGGASLARTCISLMGGTNTIDSLCIIRQFISRNSAAPCGNWSRRWMPTGRVRACAPKSARRQVLRQTTTSSNQMAEVPHQPLQLRGGSHGHLGLPLSFGNSPATTRTSPVRRPDAGDACRRVRCRVVSAAASRMARITTASPHLLAVATGIPPASCAANIMNLLADGRRYNDASFEKLVTLIETYFREGGLHVSLTTSRRRI